MVRVCDAVFPSAEVAVTVIDQRPAVSSRGGKANEPSAPTSIVVPGSGVGPGEAPGAGLPAGEGAGVGAAVGAAVGAGLATAPPGSVPRNVVVTVTDLAFVVVPSMAIAPLP